MTKDKSLDSVLKLKIFNRLWKYFKEKQISYHSFLERVKFLRDSEVKVVSVTYGKNTFNHLEFNNAHVSNSYVAEEWNVFDIDYAKELLSAYLLVNNFQYGTCKNDKVRTFFDIYFKDILEFLKKLGGTFYYEFIHDTRDKWYKIKPYVHK